VHPSEPSLHRPQPKPIPLGRALRPFVKPCVTDPHDVGRGERADHAHRLLRLIRRSDHPVLHQLLRKVIQDERRHFAFYRAQAKGRMQRSRTARRLVRWVLSNLRTPVGAGVKVRGGGRRAGALPVRRLARGPPARTGHRRDGRRRARARGPEADPGLSGRRPAPGRRAAGWARISPAPARRDLGPAPTHWHESEHGRVDVMPATTPVERREEAAMTARLEPAAGANGSQRSS
jgi:hypothetical protein